MSQPVAVLWSALSFNRAAFRADPVAELEMLGPLPANKFNGPGPIKKDNWMRRSRFFWSIDPGTTKNQGHNSKLTALQNLIWMFLGPPGPQNLSPPRASGFANL